MNTDYPNKNEILQALETEILGRTVYSVQETASTNTLAKELCREGAPHGALVICKRQTDGRGRRGREWFSQDDNSLCMSIILRPRTTAELLPRYTIASSVAVYHALRYMGIEDAAIKWPNDILINGKKVCGILFDGVFSGSECECIICGIGINVNGHPKDRDFSDSATSLFAQTGTLIDREILCAAILDEAEKAFAMCETDEFYTSVMEDYTENSCVLNKRVTIKSDKDIHGTVTGFDDLGRIILKTDDGNDIAFDSGDVSLLT